jgi:sulfite reductase (NADPH) flavoprotein alpha-component
MHRIAEEQGQLDTESAAEYIRELKDQHRYHRDVY